MKSKIRNKRKSNHHRADANILPYPPVGQVPPNNQPYPPAGQVPYPPDNQPYPPAGQVPYPPNNKPYPPAGQVPYPPDNKPYPPAGQVPYPPDNKPYPPAGQVPYPPDNKPYPPNHNHNYPPAGQVPSKPNKQSMDVIIKSVFTDDYLAVDDNGYLYSSYEYRDEFRIIFLEGNSVRLKSDNGYFIRLDEDGFLIADTDKKGSSIFLLFYINNNQHVIKAPNGYFVGVRNRDLKLIAKYDEAVSRTLFKFKSPQ